MTIQQLVVVICAYLVELVFVVYFTRPTSRRILGAFAGGAVVGLMGIGAIVLGNALEFWRVPIFWTPYFLALFYLGFAISAAPIYFITWRLARRFGWRGLVVFTCIVAVIGPPRDSLFAATFPAWMVFAPGVAPVFADAVAYVGIVLIGHAVMRLVAGRSSEDRLARHLADAHNSTYGSLCTAVPTVNTTVATPNTSVPARNSTADTLSTTVHTQDCAVDTLSTIARGRSTVVDTQSTTVDT